MKGRQSSLTARLPPFAMLKMSKTRKRFSNFGGELHPSESKGWEAPTQF